METLKYNYMSTVLKKSGAVCDAVLFNLTEQLNSKSRNKKQSNCFFLLTFYLLTFSFCFDAGSHNDWSMCW